MSMMLEEDINFIETSFPNGFRKRCQKHYALTKMNKALALHSLSCKPLPSVVKYKGCIINGVRFHTKERESRLQSQNSRIMVEGNHLDEVINFSGVLDEIIQLNYIRDKHVYLFKCNWFDVDKRKARIMHDGAITSVKVDRF
ncbi:hypothetical protein LINPERHAP1_LOCUS18499 [Linum perenne]